MTPQHEAANIDSWARIVDFIDQFSDSSSTEWRKLAHRFLKYCIDRGYNRYFRAGQSMTLLVFSTLDHHGLGNEPRITVVFSPPNKLQLTYSPSTPPAKGDKELHYELPFEEAVSTFQRFLNHLWEITIPEPIPSSLRTPDHPFSVPVL
jgi:hypothetical protein